MSTNLGIDPVREYSYDEYDNITSKEGMAYEYTSARPHAVTKAGTLEYRYDANGNLVARSDGRSLAYDGENRLRTILQNGTAISSFSYDAGLNRVKKVEGTKTTYSFFPSYEEEYVEGNSTPVVAKYYFADGRRIAQSRSDAGLAYFHADHLGSSVRMSGPEGAKLTALRYLPYGGEKDAQANVAKTLSVDTDVTNGATVTITYTIFRTIAGRKEASSSGSIGLPHTKGTERGRHGPRGSTGKDYKDRRGAR